MPLSVWWWQPVELRVSDFSSAFPKSDTGGKTHTGRKTKLFIPFTFRFLSFCRVSEAYHSSGKHV